MPMAVIPAIFTEFHSHSRTGKGGGVTRPSACSTLKPSASRQCSQEILSGIRLPVAKFPSRSEIAMTISSGNIIAAMKISSPRCVMKRRSF
ncbi:Uncharacterised protein [Salmonella enterica subsp. enterica serovar Bovismorbificans]|nr:Uncharacterised protein [Salmonella enterica subsp. enterica serovar Bovismorbificans]